jgi:S1-C subfamily serine protease
MRTTTSLLALVLLSACRPDAPAKPTTTPEPKATPPVTKVEPPPKPLTTEELFARAMDATVLVTTAWGHGTGVFIDGSGLVLTNHHVVASGRNEDFGISAMVTVSKRNEDGSISPGERFPAIAYAIDEKRDLALLKVQAEGREFPSIEITEVDPRPGAKVFALGNAGVGLGWGLKRCAVNAIGTLDEQVNAIFQLQRDEISAEERARTEEAIRKTAKEAGKQVQTDCNILPGDSGGPLVDETTGRIVGLNVAVRTALSQYVSLGSLAFHIHSAELRDFTKEIPQSPRSFLPDPWTGAGTYGALSDFDSNGEIDTLGFSGPCGDNLSCQVAFADVDENSFRGKKSVPTSSELQTSRAFDAELAIFRMARMPRKPQAFALPVSDTLAYVDSDDDGKFDRLIVADGETGGTRGYAIADGVPTRDKQLDGTALVDLGKQLGKETLRPNATRFVAALTSGVVELADPDKMHATRARLEDSTKDKLPDTLRIETRLDKRVLIDVGPKQFAELAAQRAALEVKAPKRGRAAADVHLLKALRTGKVSGDVLVVLAAPTRVYYDTDGDDRMDLVLEGASIDSGVALSAATVDASGRLSPATEHLGRLLLRPALVKDKTRADALAKAFETAFATSPRASAKDDASSFPAAIPAKVSGTSPVAQYGNRVISVFDGESLVILADLDDDAMKGKHAKSTALELVNAGKFDAELSIRLGNGVVWAYYDTNDDGRFDRVAIASMADRKKVAKAYKLGKSSVERDAAREGGALLDPKQFKGSKEQKLVTELAALFFP